MRVLLTGTLVAYAGVVLSCSSNTPVTGRANPSVDTTAIADAARDARDSIRLAGDSAKFGREWARLASLPIGNAADGNLGQPLLEMQVNDTIPAILAANCGIDPAVARHSAYIFGYHDRQQLPTDERGSTLGPEVRIYACPMKRGRKEFEKGAVVATVHVLGKASGLPAYENLGLRGNTEAFYCLYVKFPTSDYPAGMAQSTKTGCGSPTYNLQLRRNKIQGDDKYPAGIRIIDMRNRLPLIGLACLGAWCEIGYDIGTYEDPEQAVQNKVEEYKLWHDEQRVADSETGSLQAGVRARVVPVLNLGDIKPEQYRTEDGQGGVIGVQVATVHFLGTPVGKYQKDWQVEAGRNSLWLRRAVVDGVDTLQFQFVPPTGRVSSGGRWFYARHKDHQDPNIPKTARWMWDPRDETIWLACEQGCCEVDGGFTMNKRVTRSAIKKP